MQSKKWLSFLIALLVSFGLWVYVVTVENPESERTLNNIPVVFSGEDLLRQDYNLIITEDNVPTGVSLTFVGKLSDLNKMQENKDEISLMVDVSKIRTAREYSFAYDISDITLPTTVSSQSLDLSGREPKKVTIGVEQLEKKPIPVKVLQKVDIVAGYIADRLVQNYDEITIEGPVDIVSQVEYAQAILERENVDQTINTTLTYQLISKDGEPLDSTEIKADITEIEVTLPILMYKDVPLEVPLIAGGGAADFDTLVDIRPPKIRLSGDPTILSAIQSIKLSPIDLGSMMTNDETVTRIITIPEGCTNQSGEQEAIIEVQIKNKAIRQMRISSSHFTCVGLPEDLQAEIRTTALNISIRANTADINNILEENIRVVADFTGITLSEGNSTLTVPVEVYIDGFEGAGCVGDTEYSIIVDLIPVSEP